MSARSGLQPDAVCRPDGGAGGGADLLAAALVPGRAGAGPGGGALHHHHLHPEGLRGDRSSITTPALLVASRVALILNFCG